LNVRKDERAFGDSLVANFLNKAWLARVTGYIVSAALKAAPQYDAR
jgi:hypothetical protein